MVLQQFNPREKAIGLWAVVVTISVLYKKKSRKAVLEPLLRLLILIFKLYPVFIFTIAYLILLIIILAQIGIWNWMLLKGTIYCFIGIFYLLMISCEKLTNEERFFASILKNQLRIIAIIEFILNLYTFSLILEFFLVIPILTVLGLSSAMIEIKKEYWQLKKIFSDMFFLIGVILLFFVIMKVFSDFEEIVNQKNLRAFFLPPILILGFIPFFYFFAIIQIYQLFFIRIGFVVNDTRLAKFIKLKIMQSCHINFRKLIYFKKECSSYLGGIRSKADVKKMIKNTKKSWVDIQSMEK